MKQDDHREHRLSKQTCPLVSTVGSGKAVPFPSEMIIGLLADRRSANCLFRLVVPWYCGIL